MMFKRKKIEAAKPTLTGREIVRKGSLLRMPIYHDAIFDALCDYLNIDIIADYDAGKVIVEKRAQP